MSVAARTSALKNVWWIERDKLGIAKVSDADTSTDYVSPSEVKAVTVHFVKLDESFIAADTGTGIGVTESPAIPEEFHEALTYYAIARGYEMKPDTLQAANYWRGLWSESISEGKRYANKSRDGSAYHIRQYDY
tara:strand:- start:1030 stop:1431 length:402 start_codon:yes stop_codon:yes gene_type:complete